MRTNSPKTKATPATEGDPALVALSELVRRVRVLNVFVRETVFVRFSERDERSAEQYAEKTAQEGVYPPRWLLGRCAVRTEEEQPYENTNTCDNKSGTRRHQNAPVLTVNPRINSSAHHFSFSIAVFC